MKYKFLFILIFFFSGKIFAQTADDTVNLMLPRAYTELVSDNMYSLTQWIIGDCITDNSEVGGVDPYDISEFQQMMLFKIGPCNKYFSNYWFRAYNIIFHANKVIECLPRTSFTADQKKLFMAEARFVRALSYFELSRVFGSVPIITKDDKNWGVGSYVNDYVTSYAFKVEKSSVSAVYNFVETELKAIVNDLPAKQNDSNKYKATKGATNALLAKVYLYESSFAKNYPNDTRFSGLTQKWADALAFAESVINSGEYNLAGKDGETFNTMWDSSYLFKGKTTGFRYIFSKQGNYCSESVFEAERLNKEQVWESFSNNVISMYTICRYYNCNSPSNLGWGFNKPSDDLINAFKKETGNTQDDPRYIVSIGTENDSVYLNSNFMDKWCKMDFSNTNLKSACRKFEVPSADLSGGYYVSPINVRVIRYADVILMAAEAALETGNSTKALNYINMVRSRARACGSTGHPADLTTVTQADIELERRLELALEGHRFFDLVRWNKAESTLNGRTNKTFNSTVTFTKGVNEFFPIPSEAMLNSPVLVQNNGYEDFCAFLNKPQDRHILKSVKSLYVSMTNQYSGSSKSGAVLTVSSTVPSFAVVSFKNDTIWLDLKNSIGDSTFIKLHLTYSGKTKDTSFMVKSYRPDYILDSKTLRLYKAFSWSCFAQTDTIMAKFGVTSSHVNALMYTEDGLNAPVYSNMSYNSIKKNSLLKITFPKSDVSKYVTKNGIQDSLDLLIIIKGSNKFLKPVIFEAKFKTTDIIEILKYPIVKTTANKNFTLPLTISPIDTITYGRGYTLEFPKDTIYRDHKVNELEIYLGYDKNKYEYIECNFEGTILSSQKNLTTKILTAKDTTKILEIKFDGPLSGEGKLANLVFKPKVSENSLIDITYLGMIKNYSYYNKDSMRYVDATDSGWGTLIMSYLEAEPIENNINDSFKENALSIYPNPANDYLMLNSTSSSEIIIYDIYGRIVLQNKVQAGGRVELNNIKSGMYLVRIINNDRTFDYKLLKK